MNLRGDIMVMVFVRWMDRFNRYMKILLGLIFGIMVLAVFSQVVIRFVLPFVGIYLSVPWTEELARYLMIWSVFIGGALAARHAELLAVDALVFAIPTIPGKIMKVVAHLLSIAFYFCIFFIGLEWTKYGLTQTSPAMGIPMTYIYSSMAIGAGLMVLNTIILLIDTFFNKKDIREPSVDDRV